MNFNFFPQRENRIPNLNATIKAQHKHEPTMRVVRVYSKITEVKHSVLRLILRWLTIWDPNMSFFSLAMIGKNIRQICQILLISLSFGKTQISTDLKTHLMTQACCRLLTHRDLL